MDLKKIDDTLRNAYANTNGFGLLTERCEELAHYFGESNEKIYLPVEFDPAKHQISTTMASYYLELLTDEDVNAHLKKLKPVRISNDSSALFRAVALLLGFSNEADVCELRIRCLIKALTKLPEYITNNKEFLKSLYNPDEVNIIHWSNFVGVKECMDAPNTVTLLILTVLADIIQIPIQSFYPGLSLQELNDNPNRTYRYLNRTFYPSGKQISDNERTIKPITILWSCDESNDILYPVPLFSINELSECKLSHQTLRNKSESEKRPIITQENDFSERKRCTYILVSTVFRKRRATKSLRERIQKLKDSVIQRIQIVASNAREGDIIEVNTCAEHLTNPPLIPFCDSTKIKIEEISTVINAIQFREGTDSNILKCMSIALQRIARQLTYYTDFFSFCDDSNDFTAKTDEQKSAIRLLRQTQSIRAQTFVFSEQSANYQQQSIPLNLSQSNQVSNNQRHMSESNCNDNRNRHELVISYGDNNSVPGTEGSSTPVPTSNSNVEPGRVRTNSILRFIQLSKNTSSTSSQQRQNNSFFSIFKTKPSNKRESNESLSRERSLTTNNVNTLYKYKFGF